MKVLTENEMELALINMGYDIEDDDGCTDSTIVFDVAAEMGYVAKMQPDETYIFTLAD